MSGERHEDIAARLRAEAGARAPERLRADVMLRVRAEPRPRRIRPRRRHVWRPLGAVAAVACAVAALIVGVGHGLQSSPNLGAAGSTGAANAGGATTRVPSLDSSSEKHAKDRLGAPPRPGGISGSEHRAILDTSAGSALQFQGARLPLRLRRALESLLFARSRGAH